MLGPVGRHFFFEHANLNIITDTVSLLTNRLLQYKNYSTWYVCPKITQINLNQKDVGMALACTYIQLQGGGENTAPLSLNHYTCAYSYYGSFNYIHVSNLFCFYAVHDLAEYPAIIITSLHRNTYISIVSICLFVCLSLCLYVCLSVCLSDWLACPHLNCSS